MSTWLRSFAPRALCLALVAASVATPLAAQMSRLQRDADFLRKIAKDLSFISLAQEEVERLKKENKDSADFKSILQLDIEIALIGAKRHPVREERRTLYKQVLDQIDEFINKYKDDAVALHARITMIDAAYEYGRFLSDDIEAARLENPERLKQLEEDAANLFRRGVDACDAVMKQLKGSGQDRPEYMKSWLLKGVLLREHARASKKDRLPLCTAARTTFESLIFGGGEETAAGQRALFEMGQIYEVLGELDAAVQQFRDSVDSAHTALKDEANPPPANVALFIVETMEEAYDKLTSTLFNQGKSEEVLKTAEEYRARLKELGVLEEDPRWGHLVFLTEARALAESGDAGKIGKALEIARDLNKKHQGDIVGLKAKTLLKDILASQTGTISGDDLVEIAKGELQAKRYEDGIRAFKRALASMNDEQKKKLGLAAWHQIGLAFVAQERWLEAVLAMKRGFELFPPSAEDDSNEAMATAEHMNGAVKKLLALTNNDAAFVPLQNEAIEVSRKFAGKGTEAKLLFDRGRQLIDEKKFVEAADAFAKVDPSSPFYERARAGQADALHRAERIPEARTAIQQYREWLTTKDAKIDAASPGGRSRLDSRSFAQALCDYLEARILYQEAVGMGKWTQGKKDPTKLPEVVAKLSDYKQRYEKVSPGLVENALDTLARAHAALGQLDKAEEKYRTLREINAKSGALPALASTILVGHSSSVKAAETELTALKTSGKPAEIQAAQQKLTNARKAALAAGLDYAKQAGQPAFNSLYATMKIAEDLKEFDTVIQLGNQIVELYGDSKDKKTKETVDRWVRRSVGDVLLEKGDFKGAYELLAAAEKASPGSYEIKRSVCRALGGWQTIDQRGQISRVAGLDKPVEAYEKFWGEYRTYALSSQRKPPATDFTLPWYQFHWEAYDLALAAAKKDSKYADIAKKLYGIAKATDDFETLKSKLGPDGAALYQFFEQNPPPR